MPRNPTKQQVERLSQLDIETYLLSKGWVLTHSNPKAKCYHPAHSKSSNHRILILDTKGRKKYQNSRNIAKILNKIEKRDIEDILNDVKKKR